MTHTKSRKLNSRCYLTIASTILLCTSCTQADLTQAIKSPVNPSENATFVEAETTTILKSGTFTSGEHPTEGTVRLIRQDGKTYLELDQNFQTSDLGPDLVVILHRSYDVLGSTHPPAYPIAEPDYFILAPLSKFSGAQRYLIPQTVQLERYQSAAIWCRRFNATFGAAVLRS